MATRILVASTFALGALLLSACGGVAGPARADAAVDAPPDAPASEPDDGLPPIVSPPDAGCPPVEAQSGGCDPLAQTGCIPGWACELMWYSNGANDPACAGYLVGALCAHEGTGRQWEPCDDMFACAAGYECVGIGGQVSCAALCDRTAPGACPWGLACEPLLGGSVVGVCQ